MAAVITITESTPDGGCHVKANQTRDLGHIRRLLLQSLIATVNEGLALDSIPIEKIKQLRQYLHRLTSECSSTIMPSPIRGVFTTKDDPASSTRYLLLMTLLQIEDEDQAARLVKSTCILKG